MTILKWKKSKVLKDVRDYHVDEIYQKLVLVPEKGKGILDKQGTKEITGKLNSRMQ